jgi:hypothetical protein
MSSPPVGGREDSERADAEPARPGRRPRRGQRAPVGLPVPLAGRAGSWGAAPPPVSPDPPVGDFDRSNSPDPGGAASAQDFRVEARFRAENRAEKKGRVGFRAENPGILGLGRETGRPGVPSPIGPL